MVSREGCPEIGDPALRAASGKAIPAGQDHSVWLACLRRAARQQRRGYLGHHARTQPNRSGISNPLGSSRAIFNGPDRTHAAQFELATGGERVVSYGDIDEG